MDRISNEYVRGSLLVDVDLEVIWNSIAWACDGMRRCKRDVLCAVVRKEVKYDG